MCSLERKYNVKEGQEQMQCRDRVSKLEVKADEEIDREGREFVRKKDIQNGRENALKIK